MGRFSISGHQRRPSGSPLKQLIISLGLAVIGAAFGCLSRFLDIYTQNLGNIFSEMSVWVLIGTVISVLSSSPFRAGANVFAFCAGMLAAYYIYAHLSGGVYSLAFVTGWAVFSVLSPVFSFITWHGVGYGLLSIIIDSGIIAFMAVCSIVLFDDFGLPDAIFMLATIIFLLISSKKLRSKHV